MVIEAAVFGGQRRLDQVVRKIFQRDRIVVLDAAVADRVAVAVEEGDGEIGFLQPVVVGGFAKRRQRQRQHQDQAAEPDGGGFRQRLDEDPALPASDIESIHEGRVALIEFARRRPRRRTASNRCARRNPAGNAGISSSIRLAPDLRTGNPDQMCGVQAPRTGTARDVMRKRCGKPKAFLRQGAVASCGTRGLILAEDGPQTNGATGISLYTG